MARSGLGLIQYARLTRRQLIAFALVSAVLNGIVTATVGSWLAHAYATYQSRRQAVEALTHLVYERRTRAGLVASAIRREADLDEVRHRKQAYDEAYVDWNKNVMLHLFVIREILGETRFSMMERALEDDLVAAMAEVDRCLTQAYDRRVAGGDAKAVLVACNMALLHQHVLDCGATFANELYKLTQLSFLPLSTEAAKLRQAAEANIRSNCTRPKPPPATAAGEAAAARPERPDPASPPAQAPQN